MGLQPTQGDGKTPFVPGRSLMGAPPSPLSSRPKRSAVETVAYRPQPLRAKEFA
ncbi:MAG: hypothetical protein QOJ51_3066 [Acidobacteriaceae bacterium]|nr:hypothetical protein [Acidobacteriaceae bacterium]MEA2260241.1 hypothetical protein [Acidobacteriaceae bacterium]